MINELIKILDIYVEEYNKTYQNYQNKLSKPNLYLELFNCLDRPESEIIEKIEIISIIINEIYQNDLYLRKLILILNEQDPKDNIQSFINMIYRDYEELKEEIKKERSIVHKNRDKITTIDRVKTSLKRELPIRDEKIDIPNLKSILDYLRKTGKISNKEELLFLNELEYYNRRIYGEYNEKESRYADALYQEIPNILNMGLELYESPEIEYNKQEFIDKLSKEIITTINQIENNEIINLIEYYQTYNLEINEYHYLIISLLKYFQNELMTYYELLLDKDVYHKIKDRKDMVTHYYQTLDKYILVRKYYEDQICVIEEETEEQEEIETENQEERILIYSYSNVNVTKAKLISDLSNISYEYYDTIYDLISKFKNGTLSESEIKQLVGSRATKGKKELKRDQVRVVFKHIKDNIYNIYGVFIKKKNNDITEYTKLVSRIVPDISNEINLNKQLNLSKYTEEELERIVNEKKRTNGR